MRRIIHNQKAIMKRRRDARGGDACSDIVKNLSASRRAARL
ncbi:hypothetical protein DDI_3878 [Dickeya dianthicola RNS04.9]|nr:hypothetical protein DDI_3878 [Dickeya dianthicola RNS04.9]